MPKKTEHIDVLQIIESGMEVVNAAMQETPPPPIHYADTMKIMESKRFVKGGLEYKSPAELLQPCINLLTVTGGIVTLTGDNEVTNANSDGTLNRSFARLNLVTRFEIDEEVFYEVGVLIAYDLATPRIKVYRGAKVTACLNLCIFGADDVVKFDITNGVNLETVSNFIQSVADKIAAAARVISQLKRIVIRPEQLDVIIGNMLIETVIRKSLNGSTSILRAVELLTDSKCKYYYRQDGFNAWMLFNSFTEHFSSKVGLFDIPEKSRDVFSILRNRMDEVIPIT